MRLRPGRAGHRCLAAGARRAERDRDVERQLGEEFDDVARSRIAATGDEVSGDGIERRAHEQVDVAAEATPVEPEPREPVAQVGVARAPVPDPGRTPEVVGAAIRVADVIGRSGSRRPLAHRVGDAGRERAAARRRAPEARAAGDAPTLDRKLRARRVVLVRVIGVQKARVDDLGPLDEHEAEDLARLHPEAEPRARRDAIRRDRREAAAAGVKPVVEHRVERVPGPRQRRCRSSAHGPPGDAASG